MTTGGWTKDVWVPTNYFRWNKNRKENFGIRRWLHGTFTTLDSRLEQLWEFQEPRTTAPFRSEWRKVPVVIAGFDPNIRGVPGP